MWSKKRVEISGYYYELEKLGSRFGFDIEQLCDLG